MNPGPAFFHVNFLLKAKFIIDLKSIYQYNMIKIEYNHLSKERCSYGSNYYLKSIIT